MNLDSQTIRPYSVTPITGWHQSQDTDTEMGAGWTLDTAEASWSKVVTTSKVSAVNHLIIIILLQPSPCRLSRKLFKTFSYFGNLISKPIENLEFFIKTPFENVLLFISNHKISKSLDIVIVCFTLQ